MVPVYDERAAGDGGVQPSLGRHRGDAGGPMGLTRSYWRDQRRSTAHSNRRLRLRRGSAADAAVNPLGWRVTDETISRLQVRICPPWQ